MNNCKKECPLFSASLIPLTQGKYAIVDTSDYKHQSKYRWHFMQMVGGNKAARNDCAINGRKTLYMHRAIMGVNHGDNIVVDHIHHNTLDNRKSELRVCTRQQNAMNMKIRSGTSRFKGVRWHKTTKKWVSRITMNGATKHIGLYKHEIDAASAYNDEAKRLFGEFACLNEIRGVGEYGT